MPHVVVVGGGFAGVSATAELAKEGFRVTLIDRHPYNTFQPLLYQVATGGLNPGDVTYSLRYFAAKHRGVRFRRAAVVAIDHDAQEVVCDDGVRVGFDYLVIGNGITTNHFDIPGAAEFTMSMYTRAEALRVRDTIFGSLEIIAGTSDPNTGAFTKREDLDGHIRAGARYVILSAPSKSDDVETIVHGVNTPQGTTAIISCASCTTNCITPVMEILGRRIGVKKAVMTTVHGYTASQAIVDAPHPHARRGRAGAANLVPTSTGAATATTRALPEYRDRFDGVAVRAPVPVGSLADIVALAARPTTVDEVNRVFTEEAGSERYRGVLGVTTDPIVSSDIIKDSRASVVDLGMTQVVDSDLIKVMSWYDNEWGYASQIVREALALTGGR